MNYSDGTELVLRNVYIYRLDEDLTEKLVLQAEETQLRRAREGGQQTARLSPAGETNLLAQRIRALATTDFKRKSRLIERLAVEQLLDHVEAGKIRWTEPMPVEAQDKPSARLVYAVVQEDERGRQSTLSNFALVLPISSLPAPTEPAEVLTQESLTLNWNYPERAGRAERQLALTGFNIYKAPEGEAVSLVPFNATPIPSGAPLEWQPLNLISHQQVTGTSSRFAYLLFTSDVPDPAGISQPLIPADQIDSFKGSTVSVHLTVSSPGGSSRGRLVLDASRDPLKPSEPAAGSEVFSEIENPLISIHELEITTEPKTFNAEFRLPSDSRALVLKIEPRGSDPIAAAFLIESVSAINSRGDVELVKNGDFSGFSPMVYSEPIEKFGGKFSYGISAVYNISGFVVESAATKPLLVELQDTFPPEAPRNPRALATSDSIAISWNSSRSSDLRGYLVFKREGVESSWKRLTQQPQRGTIYRDTDIKPGITYSYRIQAIDRAGNRSEYSVEVTAGNTQD
ncbi:MAG TPA: fibronectin type III domain-containing protein [Acidobacteriota bacterium]|nr:fibronectin type III domain-containing protein [Acidobacteriota bacterium]